MSCFSSNSRWLRFFNTSIKATLKSAESDEISAPLLPSWEKGLGDEGKCNICKYSGARSYIQKRFHFTKWA
jgi:hypothetical protein